MRNGPTVCVGTILPYSLQSFEYNVNEAYSEEWTNEACSWGMDDLLHSNW